MLDLFAMRNSVNIVRNLPRPLRINSSINGLGVLRRLIAEDFSDCGSESRLEYDTASFLDLTTVTFLPPLVLQELR